jgi:hypothetical protein
MTVYAVDMFSDVVQFERIDNDPSPGFRWTSPRAWSTSGHLPEAASGAPPFPHPKARHPQSGRQTRDQ